MSTFLINALCQLEQRPVFNMMTREVVGINAPKVAFIRTGQEREDVFINEFGNTAGFFGAGFALDKFLNLFYRDTWRRGGGFAQAWGHFGKSMALGLFGASIMWAMPFFRNLWTAKRTGKTQYADVIVKKHPKREKHGSSHLTHAEQAEALQEKMTYYRNTGLKILGLGAVLAAGSVLLSRLAINKGWRLAQDGPFFSAGWWVNKLNMKKGAFQNIPDLQQLLFWGVPAYGGWIHASRDQFEIKEQALKFATFVLCFFGPSRLLGGFFNRKLKTVLSRATGQATEQFTDLSYKALQRQLTYFPKALKAAERLWLFKNVAGIGSSIVLLSIVPTLLNWYLTQQRLARAQQGTGSGPSVLGPLRRI